LFLLSLHINPFCLSSQYTIGILIYKDNGIIVYACKHTLWHAFSVVSLLASFEHTFCNNLFWRHIQEMLKTTSIVTNDLARNKLRGSRLLFFSSSRAERFPLPRFLFLPVSSAPHTPPCQVEKEGHHPAPRPREQHP
jgi:hypothetical protein